MSEKFPPTLVFRYIFCLLFLRSFFLFLGALINWMSLSIIMLVHMSCFSRYQPSNSQPCLIYPTGQLEFINGGWCMSDEATPYYIDMIDQQTLGHLFLLKTFGPKAIPRAGWQVRLFAYVLCVCKVLFLSTRKKVGVNGDGEEFFTHCVIYIYMVLSSNPKTLSRSTRSDIPPAWLRYTRSWAWTRGILDALTTRYP